MNRKTFILTLMLLMLAGLSAWAQNVAKIGETEYATLEAAFSNVKSGQIIYLLSDFDASTTNFTGCNNKNVIIAGRTGTEVLNMGTGHKGGLTGCTITFLNLKMQIRHDPTTGTWYTQGLNHANKIRYDKVTFDGCVATYDDVEFLNCTFTSNPQNMEYTLWNYCGTVVLDKCTFEAESAGTKSFVKQYAEPAGNSATNLAVIDTEFIEPTEKNKDWKGCYIYESTKNSAVNKIYVDSKTTTIADIIKYSDDDCKSKTTICNTLAEFGIEDYWSNFAASTFNSLDETAKTITISTPAELALLAKNVNSGISYAGYTITINGELDMTDHYWVPINASNSQLSGSTIQGTAAISNLKIEKAVYKDNYDYYAGFIAQTVGTLTVKDLNFSGAVSVDNGSGVATVLGLTYGNVLFDNVKVLNSTVTATTKAGALVGFTGGDGITVTVKNCTLENVTVKAEYSYALMVGLVNTNDHVVFEGKNEAKNSKTELDETKAGEDFPDSNGRKSINGYTYGVDDTKLWVINVKDAWAECRTNPSPTMTIDGVKYTIMGDIFYHADNVIVDVCAVAKIDNKEYRTLASAIAAVKDGETITMLKDVDNADGIIVPSSKNFTVDFGGHTYKVTDNLAGSTGTKNQCFQLLKDSELIFKNGTITTNCAKLGVNSYANLKLVDMTIDMSQTSATGQVACLETCNGSISLQGNTNLKTKNDQIAVLALYWPNGEYGDINVELNTTGEVKGLMAYGSYQVQDLSTVAQHSHVAIKNGKYDVTFDMDNLENYDFKIYGGVFKTSPATEYLAPNHEVVANTDSETSASYPHKVQQKPYVAMIGENGYFSLADALVAVKNNETIVMHQNDVLTKGLTITLENNEAFTLDLNGKTVSIAETGFDFTANGTNNALRNGVPVRFAIVVNGNGTMNICDNSEGSQGKIETEDYSYGTTKTILVDGNAVVNVNSGTIAADYAAFYVVGFTEKTAVPANAPKPTLNVNGGKIVGQKVGIGIKGNTATLKVTGGEIIANEYTGVSTNGTQDWYDGGKFAIEITGGLIKSGEGAAMYLPAEGPTVITGGTIEGADGIVVKGGSLSISGNTIVKATGSFGQAASALSGYTDTGSAIYVEDTYENHAPIVNISGGKFSSKNNKAVEYYTTKADDAKDKGKLTVYAGLYDDDSAKGYLADGKTVIGNPDKATQTDYPCAVVPLANEVQVAAEVEITSVDEESSLTPGQQTAAETTVSKAIEDMAGNTEVANLLDDTKTNNNKAVATGVVGTGQSVGINVEFTGTKVSVEETGTGEDAKTTVTLKELTFDVTPYVVETKDSKAVAVKKIENEQIKAPMTFRLPIPSSVEDNYARVIHYVGETNTEDMGLKEIKSTTDQTEQGKTYKYIEIITTSFSKFEAILKTVNLSYYYVDNSERVEKTGAAPSTFQSAQQDTYKNAIAFVSSEYAEWASGQTNVVVDYSVGTNGHYYECPNFVLTDLKDFYTPVDFHVVNGSYTRENTGNLNTVCLPFELSSTDVNNGQIGVFHSTDMYDDNGIKASGNVYFNVVENVNPGTPCIIACDENDAGWNIDLAGKTVAANPNNVNALKGSYVEETIGVGVYKVDSNGEKFGKTTSVSETVAPFRAYLDLKHGSGMETNVKDLNIEWADDATGIENVKVASDSKVIYDLTGRMVNNPVKGGLYIINGKKVIFK